jgi:hypothetical protein
MTEGSKPRKGIKLWVLLLIVAIVGIALGLLFPTMSRAPM